jgi:acyl dehydratase
MSDRERRLCAEDLPVGETIELGDYAVTRDEILEFASRWDPQPHHIDPVFARTTLFGDVIGSGLHTMAIFQSLAVVGAYGHWAIVAGRAIRDINFTSPLRPDSTVRGTLTVDSVIPHSEERALVVMTGQLLHGDLVVMTKSVDAYVSRRRG